MQNDLTMNEDDAEQSGGDDERTAHSGSGGVVLTKSKAEIYIGKASPSRRVGKIHRAEKNTEKS